MDTLTPRHYLLANFEHTDWVAVVAINRSTKDIKPRIATVERISQDSFQRSLHVLNTNHYDIYISMNSVHQNAQGRKKSDIAQIRHVYLDFDIDGTHAVQRMMARSDMPMPNHLIESSPGKWQVIWRVEGFGATQAEELMRGMVREFGADPAATDVARVLRLPGYLSHKYEQPRFVTVQNLSTEVYSPSRFPNFALNQAVIQFPHAPYQVHAHRRRGNQTGISQSERDWAYAKRALARGEDPEVIIQAIAAFRTDKPDPQYYARHTVTKAAAGMEQAKPDHALAPGFGLG
ncbi:MAG: hypothetical protein JO227_11965 [Acetobacteraceae bacterium]|nr:hypothetical protein [Acetobacteraceae bacterium]